MNTIKKDRLIMALHLMVEGSGLRSISRITKIHRTALMRYLVQYGSKAAQIMDIEMRQLECTGLQVDEVWTYVGKKQKNLKPNEIRRSDLGSIHIFTAIDSKTKLMPCAYACKRSEKTTVAFIEELGRRVRQPVQLTTDAFPAYRDAIYKVFGRVSSYVMLRKKMAPPSFTEDGQYDVEKYVSCNCNTSFGNPQQKLISVSAVERANLSIRNLISRMQRRTITFSKKKANLTAALMLFLVYYNFCFIHATLKQTPAMEANLTDHQWTIEEFIDYKPEEHKPKELIDLDLAETEVW